MLKTIKIAVFFFLLYCAPVNQFLYWASILLLPLLFFGIPKNNEKCKLHKLILVYFILAIATLITGLVSSDLYHPTKAAVLMAGCALVSICMFVNIKTEKDLKVLNDGVILGTLLFSVIVLFLLYDGGFALTYSDEDSWLGKNLLSLNFFAGAVCAAINFKMLKNWFIPELRW